VDRDDPVCTAPADGAGAGLADAAQAKALIACGKAIAKAGTKTAATHLAQLRRCLGIVTTCVQVKPGDPACLAKARATCDKALATIAKSVAAVPAAIAKRCAATTVPSASLLLPAGLGYVGETARCAAYGAPPLNDLAAVTTCVTDYHACAAARVVTHQYPRAAELLRLVDLGTAGLPCLNPVTDGGGLGLDRPDGSAAAKCQKAIGKAGATYFKGRTAATRRCAGLVSSCLQLKPGDPACLTKAATTCAAAAAKVPGVAAKMRGTITASCGRLDPARVLAPDGLGFEGLADACAARGVTSLADERAIADCLVAQHACQADQMLEIEVPRLRELFGLVAVPLP
jgi:hypothetical protein